MNWEERISQIPFSITTGDGKVFFPLYKGGEKEKEYNTAVFDFIAVRNSLVTRKLFKSPVFPLVFWFSGENNIDEAQEFEASADDPRPWTVVHPFYGTINGQPLSIKRDDSNLNITEITVPFWLSIEADYPVSNFSVKDNTREKRDQVYTVSSLSYVTNVEFAAIDVSKNAESIQEMAGDMQNLQDDSTYALFQNTLNAGLKAIDKLTENPLNAIESIQAFLDLPSTYELAIEGRIAAYESIYRRLKNSIITLADKKYFETIGGSTIASLAVTAVNPVPGDYVLVSSVENVTARLLAMYNDYVNTLDELKVSIYNVNNTYAADASVQTEINSLVNYTVANLYQMSFSSKRERIIFAPKKTNVILLVHRLIGLDENDENLNAFIEANNIKLKELFSIEKGRELRYTK